MTHEYVGVPRRGRFGPLSHTDLPPVVLAALTYLRECNERPSTLVDMSRFLPERDHPSGDTWKAPDKPDMTPPELPPEAIAEEQARCATATAAYKRLAAYFIEGDGLSDELTDEPAADEPATN